MATGTSRLLLACFVIFAPPALFGVEYFSDDFEGYIDDLELVEAGGWTIRDENTPAENASWTLGNPCGRANPPTANGFPSEGRFIISDSDCAAGSNPSGTGMSHDIWSPPFSCEGATRVWLHMDCAFQPNNNGLCAFDVDVSIDGGSVWTNVFRRVAPARVGNAPVVTSQNADGFFGRLDVDISSLAAGNDEVMFRLRHFEPNDDWWIAVDDVLVDDQAPAKGDVTLLFETFEGGLPASWQVRSDAEPPREGNDTWNANDPCGQSHQTFNGGVFPDGADGRRVHRFAGRFASVDGGCAVNIPADEYLMTPTLDLRNATAVFLGFKSSIVPSSSAAAEVLLSTDGGDTFDTLAPIFSYALGALLLRDTGNPDAMYNDYVFPVPEAAREGNVVFAFHYSNLALENRYWAIDDVRVSVNGEGFNARNCLNREFSTAPFDPIARSVSMSWRPLTGDEGFRILANGQQVGGDLPANATSFTDANPPAVAEVVYSLQSLKGGSVEFTCAAPPVRVVVCPRDLSCCVDQRTGVATIRWTQGINTGGTGYRLTRDGALLRALPLTASSFVDDTVPGPGAYKYELSVTGINPGFCPALPLACTATVSGGDILLYDDFDCYLNDDILKASGWEIHEENQPRENAFWTVTNPGGRANPPLRDGKPSAGRFIVSDSDAAGGDDEVGTGMSHDIWSPSFDASGKDVVWLHMDTSLVMNNNGVCVFDVDVSTDNGAGWTNVFRRVAPARPVDAVPPPLTDIPEDLPGGPQAGNADGFYGPLDIDISALAANKANVRFRLRQFEPDDDWWFAVDNVVVDSAPVLGGEHELLASEGFADGIPDSWDILQTSDSATWTASDTCQVSLLNLNGGVFPDGADGRRLHYFDAAFALVYADEFCGSAPVDESLVTPTIDCSQMTRVFLHLKSGLVVTDAAAEVLISLDGGATFDAANPLFSYQGGGGMLRDPGNAEAIYNEYILEVPRAAGEKTVAFAFHYGNPAGRVAYWAIDDVRVSGDGELGTQFKRGDGNADGDVNIADASFVLNYLFLGGRDPSCLAAADANGDGQVNIADASFGLNFLFLGGPNPPAPFPDCGLAPGEVDCASYPACAAQ
jgi:hypothetical protein